MNCNGWNILLSAKGDKLLIYAANINKIDYLLGLLAFYIVSEHFLVFDLYQTFFLEALCA